MGIWYATREEVKGALDFKETARNNAQVDRALEGASRSVETLCHRRFYPEIATRLWDWPDGQYARPWRLWLDDRELISVSSLSAGGTVIPSTDYFLEPNRSGPPYNRVEVDLASSSAFGGGDTHQRNISISGLYGYRDDETTLGATVEALDASETGVDIDAATSAQVGVGSLLRIDSERLLVTGRSMLDTGQNLGISLTASAANVSLTVADGTQLAVDETILIDSERMLIVDIAGNSLTVKRAWDGSVLAAHTAPADIYAARSLTVQRAAAGSTAAAHSSSATVHRWDPPGTVRLLTIAETVNVLSLELAGYSRVLRSGEGAQDRNRDQTGLNQLRNQVYEAHGRKARLRGV